MIEKIRKFINRKYAVEDLKSIKEIFTDNQYNALLNREMRRYWKELDQSGRINNVPENYANKILDSIHHRINILEIDSPKDVKFWKGIWKVAAILFIPVFISLLVLSYLYVQKPGDIENTPFVTTIEAPLGAKTVFFLPDSTKVSLNSGSILSFMSSFRGEEFRKVYLQGEAYLQVRENSNQPFIVETENIDVKVLGTAFNLRAYSDELSSGIALYEGEVEIGTFDNNIFKKSAVINPGEFAFYSKSKKEITLLKENNLSKHRAWTEGRTEFKNDPLEVVINKFKKLFNVDIIVEDKTIFNYTYTATFINENLERALDVITHSSPVKYTIIDNIENKDFTKKRVVILHKVK